MCSGGGTLARDQVKECGCVDGEAHPTFVREKVILSDVRSRSVGAKVKFTSSDEAQGVYRGKTCGGSKFIVKYRPT